MHEKDNFKFKINGDLNQNKRESEVMNVTLTFSETLVSTQFFIVLYWHGLIIYDNKWLAIRINYLAEKIEKL